jgi:DNA-binding transcriptional MerR regulator/uncharacterized protein YbaR (Trm112 family)
LRTGDFAKKYNLSPNGVRFYVEQGLLFPEKKNKQYTFNKACEEIMEYIIELKDLGFSLSEIRKILYIKKYSMFELDRNIKHHFKDFLKIKKRELLCEIDELHKCVLGINNEIAKIDQHSINNLHEEGYNLSLDFLDILSCPKCGDEFTLINANIERKSIIQGKLICKCGYIIDIEEGILIGSQTSSKSLEWSTPVSIAFAPTSQYISMEAKAYAWVMENLSKTHYRNKTIFSSGGYAGNFFCEYFSSFGKDTLIVIADKYIDTVKNVRSKLGRLNFQLNIMYLCDENFELPLKEKSIDIFLDDYSSSEFIFYDSCYPINRIEHLLSDSAYIVGVFHYYNKDAKTLKRIKLGYPNADINKFQLGTFRHNLTQLNIRLLNSNMAGCIKTPGSEVSFEYHDQDDHLCFFNYFGEMGVACGA